MWIRFVYCLFTVGEGVVERVDSFNECEGWMGVR